MRRDRYGLAFSTASLAASAAYLEGLDRFLSADAGAADAFSRALKSDEGFALARIGLARCLQVAGDGVAARQAARDAIQLSSGLPVRECSHVAALAAVIEGASDSLSRLLAHLRDFPADAMVLAPVTAVFGPLGFSGRIDRNAQLFEIMSGIADRYGDDWWFSAWYGFVHTETGRYQRGREIVERAFAANPRNANAAHALAHALYEAGDERTGADLLGAWLPQYPAAAPLHCHLSWHLALFELEGGRVEAMWDIFRAAIAPGGSQLAPPINTLTDSISLLWRARLAGHDAPVEAWRQVIAFAHARLPRGAPFADVHTLIAAAVVGDEAGVAATLATLRASADSHGAVLAELAAAVVAFCRGDLGEAAERLARFRDEFVRVGGSGAQRDLFVDTWLAACSRSGRRALAEAWLAKSDRPRARDRRVLARLA